MQDRNSAPNIWVLGKSVPSNQSIEPIDNRSISQISQARLIINLDFVSAPLQRDSATAMSWVLSPAIPC
jgi:hypothetical protein